MFRKKLKADVGRSLADQKLDHREAARNLAAPFGVYNVNPLAIIGGLFAALFAILFALGAAQREAQRQDERQQRTQRARADAGSQQPSRPPQSDLHGDEIWIDVE